MATSKGSSLHTILNSLERANKQDCIDFSQGHLNENKLLKITEKTSVRSWASAKKGQVILTPRSTLTRTSNNRRANVPMQDALLKFSIGTNGTIPVPPVGKKPTKSSRSSVRKTTERQPSYLEDGILIEEFISRDPMEDLMLSPRKDRSPRISQDLGHTAITKRDQYLKRQIVETDLIRKQDAREQNVLSGFKVVEHLERKLKHDLDELDLLEQGPNFHRLQIYGNVFEDLISEATIFGPVLKSIKNEYDSYTAYLLDNNPTQHQLLQEQICQIAERKLTPDSEFSAEKLKLLALEQEAETLLAENKLLREKIDREKRGVYTPVKSSPISRPEPPARQSPRGKDIADRIQGLRSSILEHLDEIQDIRKDLRQNYVPVAVVHQLEQCVKENEVENQNLARKNEGHEKNIEELVQSLEKEIKAADTSESDERRIWRRLMPRDMLAPNTSKSQISSRASPSSTRTMVTPSTRTGSGTTSGSESEDEDDNDKWNWYIS